MVSIKTYFVTDTEKILKWKQIGSHTRGSDKYSLRDNCRVNLISLVTKWRTEENKDNNTVLSYLQIKYNRPTDYVTSDKNLF